MKMNNKITAEVKGIMEHISRGASNALLRAGRMRSADDMTDDEHLALAKEVEEVGELVRQLENTNPHITTALFEVPHGKWRGWSGLINYRNKLAHRFRTVTSEELLEYVMKKLSLHEVADLLEAVTTVEMLTTPFDLGSESDVRVLPRTSDMVDLQPGASIIVLRFDQTGELMAARSWRDERDNWRTATRWVRTQAEDDCRLVMGLRDTECLLVPQVTSSDGNGSDDSYNLLSTPNQPYLWLPKVLSQSDSSHVIRKRRS